MANENTARPIIDWKWLLPVALAVAIHFGYFLLWAGQVSNEIQATKQQYEQIIRRLERMEQFFMRLPMP